MLKRIREKKENRSPCSFFGGTLQAPCVCNWSLGFLYGSIVAFVVAGIIVLIAGLAVIGDGVAHEKNNKVVSFK